MIFARNRDLERLERSFEEYRLATDARLKSLEDNVAWLGTAVGGSSVLAKAPVLSIGSSAYDFVFYRTPDGVEYAFISNKNEGSTPLSLWIYKNGSLIATEPLWVNINSSYLSYTNSYGYAHPPVVVIPELNKCFWVKANFYVTYDGIVNFYLMEFSFSADTSSAVAGPLEGAKREDALHSQYSAGMSLTYDRSLGNLYLGTYSYAYRNGDYTDVQIWEFDNTGTLIHEVLHKQVNDPGAAYQGRANRIHNLTAQGGYLYWGSNHTNITSNLSEACVFYIDQTSVGATTYSTLATHSIGGSWGANRQYKVFDYGLYCKYNSTTLTALDSTTWDLSSYWDTDHHFSVIRRVGSGQDYEVLTRKATTVYLLSLSSAGGVTLISSRAVSSDMDYASYYRPQTIPFADQDNYPTAVYIGSAKSFLSFSPPSREVT